MRLATKVILFSSFFSLLAGCSSLSLRGPTNSKTGSGTSTGGYYKDDGPGATPPSDLAGIPDATPRVESLHRYANRPYTVMGKDYTPMAADSAYQANGLASWYGRRYHGKPTASGETYDMYAMTAAHTTLPIPSYVRVTNPKNGRSVVVRINDRGPFHDDRLIDLSYTAAWKLGLLGGVSEVSVEKLNPETYSANTGTALPGLPTALAPGLYLQLAALSNPAAADDLIEKIQNRQAILQLPGLHRVDSDSLVKIQAGPFAAPGAADNAARSIEQEFGIKPFRIVR